MKHAHGRADNVTFKDFLNKMCVENALAVVQRSQRSFLLVEFEYLIQRHRSQFIYKPQNSCSALQKLGRRKLNTEHKL
jgi:hypothetical protein